MSNEELIRRIEKVADMLFTTSDIKRIVERKGIINRVIEILDENGYLSSNSRQRLEIDVSDLFAEAVFEAVNKEEDR